MNQGSVAIRDVLYGVVSGLARSDEFCRHGSVFRRGDMLKDEDLSQSVSVDTASLLFGCAANEEDTLRPRAVAALDALLASYCRTFVTANDTDIDAVMSEADKNGNGDTSGSGQTLSDVPVNPWGAPSAVSTAEPSTPLPDQHTTDMSRNKMQLAAQLMPMLWSAAQHTSSKSSRLASARWARELLRPIDLPRACHLLCFLAGDSDVPTSAIAREGLGLQTIGNVELERAESESTVPDFHEMTTILFTDTVSLRPSFYAFNQRGKAAALRFALMCMLEDIYGGDNGDVEKLVHALASTLTSFGSARDPRSTSSWGPEAIDLLDECAICFEGCLSVSTVAREMVVNESTSCSLEDMEVLAVATVSSKARRFLAAACGRLYQDAYSNYDNSSCDPEFLAWVKESGIHRPLKAAATKLTATYRGRGNAGETHGAAFLGAHCVRTLRTKAAAVANPTGETLVSDCWTDCASILCALGDRLADQDEVIGNACGQSIGIALSYNGMDAIKLNPALYGAVEHILNAFVTALKRFGNGDHTDAQRTITLAQACGASLASSTSASGLVSDSSRIGAIRLDCIDALFALLGSMSNRKDDEVALVTGEALAAYADAFSPRNAVWSTSVTEWPEMYDEALARELPPHQQVRPCLFQLPTPIASMVILYEHSKHHLTKTVHSYVVSLQVFYTLLNHTLKASSPQQRTATAPALLAIVARATRLVRTHVE